MQAPALDVSQLRIQTLLTAALTRSYGRGQTVIHIGKSSVARIQAKLARVLPAGVRLCQKDDATAFLKRLNARIDMSDRFPFLRLCLRLARVQLVGATEGHPLAFDCSQSVVSDASGERWLKVTWKQEGDEFAAEFVDYVTRLGLDYVFAAWQHIDTTLGGEALCGELIKRTHTRLFMLREPHHTDEASREPPKASFATFENSSLFKTARA
jgi:hypothetical protein